MITNKRRLISLSFKLGLVFRKKWTSTD